MRLPRDIVAEGGRADQEEEIAEETTAPATSDIPTSPAAKQAERTKPLSRSRRTTHTPPVSKKSDRRIFSRSRPEVPSAIEPTSLTTPARHVSAPPPIATSAHRRDVSAVEVLVEVGTRHCELLSRNCDAAMDALKIDVARLAAGQSSHPRHLSPDPVPQSVALMASEQLRSVDADGGSAAFEALRARRAAFREAPLVPTFPARFRNNPKKCSQVPVSSCGSDDAETPDGSPMRRRQRNNGAAVADITAVRDFSRQQQIRVPRNMNGPERVFEAMRSTAALMNANNGSQGFEYRSAPPSKPMSRELADVVSQPSKTRRRLERALASAPEAALPAGKTGGLDADEWLENVATMPERQRTHVVSERRTLLQRRIEKLLELSADAPGRAALLASTERDLKLLNAAACGVAALRHVRGSSVAKPTQVETARDGGQAPSAAPLTDAEVGRLVGFIVTHGDAL